MSEVRPDSQEREGMIAGFTSLLRLDLATADARGKGGRWILLAAVLATLVVFSGLRLGISQIYTESIPFLVLAIAIGGFGRGIGFAFVVGHIALDTFRYLTLDRAAAGYAEVNAQTAVGRLAAGLLLWMLVILVPLVGRAVEHGYQRRRPGIADRYLAALLGAAAIGLMTYCWANLEPYVIRPVFEVAPPMSALVPQQQAYLLAALAAMVGFGVTVLLRRRPVDLREIAPVWRLGTRNPVIHGVGRIVSYALLLVFIRGLIATPQDVAILVVGWTAGEVTLFALRRWPTGWSLLSRIPAVVRLGVALAVTLGLGVLCIGIWPDGTKDSSFFPLVVAIALAVPVTRLLLAPGDGGAQASGARGRPTTALASTAASLLGGLLALALVLALPAVALADNCATLGDCQSTLLAAAIAAFGGLFAAIAAAASSLSNWVQGGDDSSVERHGAGGQPLPDPYHRDLGWRVHPEAANVPTVLPEKDD